MRVRYSLRVLILLVTATVLFLGFSQYRRREILKVCDELRKDGYVFSVPNDLRDQLWQRIPTVASVVQIKGRPYLHLRSSKWGMTVLIPFLIADPFTEKERLERFGMLDYGSEILNAKEVAEYKRRGLIE